ncbi:MAG: capsid protein [Mobilitalea sp.]
MRWLDKMTDKVKSGIRSWLRIEAAQRNTFQITETLDYEANAIKNRIWYRGDSDELTQLYSQMPGDRTRFWAATSTPGLEIRKIHTGLPGMIVEVLTSLVVADMNNIKITEKRQIEWKEIAEDNNFNELVSDALIEALYIGDGAFKISFDTILSKYPIIEFYPGDRIDINYDRGRIKEVVFKTVYVHDKKEYLLLETYGYGYINYELQCEGKVVNTESIPATAGLMPVVWSDNFCMAIPFKIFKSSKWKGRGKSIFDGKADNFDSFDEAWSQWMDALRRNRTKEYIPEDLLPRNPNTGEVLKPNAFDNSYIKTDSPMQEGVSKKIELIQGNIPYESYLSTYITALDLCLQGIISPSTLGIDVKKLDNADAQREKEKATLYTRNKIVEALQNTIPKIINTAIKAWDTWNRKPIEELKVDVPFGEYANPSFESQIETVGKGKTQGIMSIEACVDELYGDSKDDEWKAEEVKRLKAEQGIVDMEEPALNMEGVELDEGQSNGSIVSDEQKGIPGAIKGSV